MGHIKKKSDFRNKKKARPARIKKVKQYECTKCGAPATKIPCGTEIMKGRELTRTGLGQWRCTRGKYKTTVRVKKVEAEAAVITAQSAAASAGA